MLVSIPPSRSVGSFVRLYKTNSSRNVKKQFEFLKKVYWGTDSLWSDGYFVSTVGVNEKIIRAYIKRQGAEDAGRTATLFD
jgi:putative transposase